MPRSICLQDLEFRQIPLTSRSMRGVPYQQWIRIGMPRIPPNVIQSVFYLYANKEDARAGKNPGGSGFIVEVSENAKLKPHYYGITNKHVVCDNEDIYPVVRLNTTDGKIDVLGFNPDQWEFLRRKYDVAVIPLTLGRDHAVSSISMFSFVKELNVYGVGDDVFMIGLFIDHAGFSTNVPAARFGHISMLPDDRATIRQATGYDGVSYVIDMHSRTGFSGSPVFAYRTFGSDLTETWGHSFDSLELDRAVDLGYPSDFPPPISRRGRLRTRTEFNFLGIHWGQFPEEWELSRKRSIKEARKRGLITEGEYIKGMSGMTCVIPAWQILEVLNMPKLKSQRKSVDDASKDNSAGRPLPESSVHSREDANPNHLEDFNRLVDVAARKRPRGDQS